MRARSIRVTAFAAVTAIATGLFYYSGTLAANADTTVVTPPSDDWHFFPAVMRSIGDLAVDRVHQRLIASDPDNGTIASATYTGDGGDTVTGLPSVAGLALSADSTTLYAAVPSAHAVIAYSTSTYAETARFALDATVYPRDVVVAGGRLWFSFDDNVSTGDFGSIDPVTKVVTKHGSRLFYRAPLITAGPAAVGLIALSDNSGTSGNQVHVYDVSSGTAERKAATSVGGLSFIRDLALSADGSRVVVAGAGGTFRLLTGDLSVEGKYLEEAGSAVDVAADGRVAVAARTERGTADLYAYDAGSSIAAQAYDMPLSNLFNRNGPDEIVDNGIIFQPDGKRLFVVTDNAGLIGFRAFNEPVATAIALTGPVTAAQGVELTIAGAITGSLPAGTALTVKRDDAEATGTVLDGVITDARGNFTITDVPRAGGQVTYRVSYPGDESHLASAVYSKTVKVSMGGPVLLLQPSGTVNGYGSTVTVSAMMSPTFRNRTLELWADPAGADQPNRLLKKATVDADGHLSASLRLTRNTVISAVFTGDTRNAPRTTKSTVSTRVAVTTAVTGHYKTAGGYYQFRKTKNPVFTTTMTPGTKRKQRLVFEYYSAGKWRTWKGYTLALNSAGKSVYKLAGTHRTGVKYRVRAAYLTGTSGDSLNYSTYGPYRYFRFTN